MYNLIFTSVPIIWFSIYDQEQPREVLAANPRRYYKDIGQLNLNFDSTTFWRFFFQASGYALFMVFLVGFSFEINSLNPLGHPCSFWLVGMIIYSYVVVLVNVEIAYQTHSHSYVSAFFQLASVLLFYLMYYIQNHIEAIPVFFGTFFYMWQTPQYFFCLMLLVIGQILCHISYSFAKIILNELCRESKKFLSHY